MHSGTTAATAGVEKTIRSRDPVPRSAEPLLGSADLQAAGLYMYFEVFFGEREGCGPGEIRMGNRKILMFGSNDYLDLITHPKVLEESARALRKYGSGYSGSRLLNGTLDLHIKLEAQLATLVRKETAIIFGTGFQANYAALSALAEKRRRAALRSHSARQSARRRDAFHRAYCSLPAQRLRASGAVSAKLLRRRTGSDRLGRRFQHGRRLGRVAGHRRPGA